MYKTIFQYELKYWFKQPSTYIYAIILFLVVFVTMTGMATEPPIRFNGRMVNSASSIYNMIKLFMLLAFLLLPAVMGLSIYRDFTTNMHTLLYSYPLVKKQYLLAKFLSGFIVFSSIVGMLGLGYLVGLQMPWVNPASIQPFNLLVYLQLYGVLLLPNLLLLGIIVFGLVLWTRNIYIGFVAVLLLILFPQVTGAIFAGEGYRFWAALFDPMGVKSFSYYTHNWTVAEENELLLPIKGVVIYNRLLWISVSCLIFVVIYKSFQFQQNKSTFSFWKGRILSKSSPTLSFSKRKNYKMGSITKVVLPSVRYEFFFLQQLKTAWKLSNFDFRFILTGQTFY